MNRLLKLAAFLVCILVMGICAHIVFRGMPVLPSNSYQLTVTKNGRPMAARLLHPPSREGQYYVALGDASEPAPVLYRWFHVDFPRRRVSIGDGPEEPKNGPAYLRGDQQGLGLPSSKMEDYWTVDFKSVAGGVRFSNATLSITLKPE